VQCTEYEQRIVIIQLLSEYLVVREFPPWKCDPPCAMPFRGLFFALTLSGSVPPVGALQRAREREGEKEESTGSSAQRAQEGSGEPAESAWMHSINGRLHNSEGSAKYGVRSTGAVRSSPRAGKVPSTGRDREPLGLREPGRYWVPLPASCCATGMAAQAHGEA
jgi:hypothetical protein